MAGFGRKFAFAGFYPGGMTEISRGLSECDTPGSKTIKSFFHPGGMTDEAAGLGGDVTMQMGSHL